MKKTKWAVVILVLAIVSISCQLFAPTGNKDGVKTGDANRVFAEQPTFDLTAPLPSPGAAALRILAGWDPGAAEPQGDVEAAERAALNAFIQELSLQPGSQIPLPFQAAQAASLTGVNRAVGALVPVGYHRSANLDESLNTTHDVSLLAGLITGLGDMISQHMPAGASVSPSQTTKEGDTATTMSADIGKSTDGSSKFGLGFKSETNKNGSTTNSDVAASVDGQRCPNAEGQVSFTVKVRLGADSGNNGFTQDLTAFVRAVVDDNAQIATTTIDILEGTRQVKNGRAVFVETGMTVKYTSDGKAGMDSSNIRLIRNSQDVTQADVSALSESGHEAGFAMGRTALLIAQNNWRDGGCVKIEAASPGTVKPGSTNPIAVTVMHKFDGSSVPSKLEAALSGETSLVPASLAKTPGTLTYTAPGEIGKSATIKLTATSRRGIATLDLTASTGGQSFTFDGDNNGAHFSGTICSPDKPFEMKVDATDVTWIQTFTPNSAAGGQMEGSYSLDSCTFTANGPYTITLNADGSGTLQWTNNWTADCPGVGSRSGTVAHELPLQPASENACP